MAAALLILAVSHTQTYLGGVVVSILAYVVKVLLTTADMESAVRKPAEVSCKTG